nr:E3 ubiquitin-protein ligase HERC2-like [Vicugna pacos]
MKASPVLTPLCWGIGGPIMRHGPKVCLQMLILLLPVIKSVVQIILNEICPSLATILLSLGGNLAKQQALSPILIALQIMYARDAVVGALMPASMVTPVECPLFCSSAPPSYVSAIASPVNGEEYVLAVDTEDRLDPNPWQEKRGEIVSSEDAVTPSAVTLSASSASSQPFIPVTDDPGAASIIAETITKAKEVADTWLELWVTESEDITTDSRVATCPPSPWWWRAAIPTQMTLPPVAQ